MFGDIFICQFPFTSGAASKIRPALVLFDLEQDAIICRVTGVLRAGAVNECSEDDPQLLAALDEAIQKAEAAPQRGHSGDEVRSRLSKWISR